MLPSCLHDLCALFLTLGRLHESFTVSLVLSFEKSPKFYFKTERIEKFLRLLIERNPMLQATILTLKQLNLPNTCFEGESGGAHDFMCGNLRIGIQHALPLQWLVSLLLCLVDLFFWVAVRKLLFFLESQKYSFMLFFTHKKYEFKGYFLEPR